MVPKYFFSFVLDFFGGDFCSAYVINIMYTSISFWTICIAAILLKKKKQNQTQPE